MLAVLLLVKSRQKARMEVQSTSRRPKLSHPPLRRPLAGFHRARYGAAIPLAKAGLNPSIPGMFEYVIGDPDIFGQMCCCEAADTTLQRH